VNIDGDAILRLRFCARTACRAAFTICVSCDRGQRYCSPDAGWKYGDGSDMRLTVATSKASREGSAIAFASGAIAIRSANPP
jgi:hypothetical protein